MPSASTSPYSPAGVSMSLRATPVDPFQPFVQWQAQLAATPFWKREWSNGMGERVLANTPLAEGD
jgi:hypothetical protein